MSTLRSAIFGSLLWEILLHLSLALEQPSGFISIDCGSKEESYVYSGNGLIYTSDSNLMKSGEVKAVPSSYVVDGYDKYLWHLRTFPKGKRNCYTLQPVNPGSKYLVRAIFLYGNFDGLNSFPQFDLYLENTFVQTVNSSVSTWWAYEFIVKATRSYLTLCLCKTTERDPFISAIDLRPMPDAIYPVVNATLALNMQSRKNYGTRNSPTYRYPADAFDRFWFSSTSPTLESLSTTLTVSSTSSEYAPPSIVMQTAYVSPNASDGIISISNSSQNDYLFICIHFAELKKLEANETREFNVTLDSKLLRNDYRPLYRASTTVCSDGIYPSQNNVVEYTPTERSTLSPIVNAAEVYNVVQLSGSATNDGDGSSLVDIRDRYKITKAWTGDPCLPLNYTWEGLVCSNDTMSPRVISLDLSNSGLSGEIPSSMANFSALVNLNLSGNNLTGNIPVFLANLPQLKILDLSDNDLSGCMPDDLQKKLENGRLLVFRRSGNEKLLSSGVCTPHRKKFWKRLTIGTTVSAALLFLLVASSIIFVKWKKRNPPGEKAYSGSNKGSVDKNTGCQVFTYSDVVAITVNFKEKIGEGGFGSVYLGHLHGQDVAVKMISHKSKQGSKEFYTEVALLSRVHHRNLVHFIGYCDEAENMILLYEYLSNGNLGKALSEVDLDWNQRLQIALDAAQGLDYLHAWCKPAVIHRDVKSTNILLNDKFEAKIADFGLSKSGMPDGFSHVSTVVVGTPGYLDPEYSTSCWLNEKSDVYSFGVVLLELVSGKLHVIDEASNQRIHIVEWVQQNVLRSNHANVADPRLCGRYDVGSLWRVVDLALQCTRDKGINRPNMSFVVTELKEVVMLCRPTQVQHEIEECNYSHSSGSAPMGIPFPTSL